jgi:hypothetical protein
MKKLHNEIEIDATPEEVWSVLVDLRRYAEWNPFITQARGVIEEGAKLRVRMSPLGGRAVTLHPTVTEVRPGRSLEWWGGHVGVRGRGGRRPAPLRAPSDRAQDPAHPG